MPKSPDAFRTISEVADWLDVQAHVLRFWESKFTQVKPIKRAGGRRYYRPGDMLLLGGIKKLLHDDGLTIKGVQKILREEGMGHVAKLSQPLDDQMAEVVEAEADTATPDTPEAQESGVVLDFAANGASDTPSDAAPDTASEAPTDPEPTEDASTLPAFVHRATEAPAQDLDDSTATEDAPAPEDEPEDARAAATEDSVPDTQEIDTEAQSADEDRAGADALQPDEAAPADAVAEEAATEESAPETPPARKPRIIDMPPLTPEADFPAQPSVLTAAFRTPGLNTAQARDVAPLLQQLVALRDKMQNARRGGGAKG